MLDIYLSAEFIVTAMQEQQAHHVAERGAVLLLNMTSTLTNHVTDPPLIKCQQWNDTQHFFFQLANICFAISFLIPNSFTLHLFLLRAGICLGSFLLILWGGFVVCHGDVIAWYLVFLLINLGHLSYLAYTIFLVQFPAQLEEVYTKAFKPFHVTRFQFRELANQGQITKLPDGASYAIETVTHAGEKVSILIAGR